MCTPGRMIDMLGANSGEFKRLDPRASFDGMRSFEFEALRHAWSKCHNIINSIMMIQNPVLLTKLLTFDHLN